LDGPHEVRTQGRLDLFRLDAQEMYRVHSHPGHAPASELLITDPTTRYIFLLRSARPLVLLTIAWVEPRSMLSTQAQQWVLKTWTEEVRRREEALEDCAEEKQSSDQRSAHKSTRDWRRIQMTCLIFRGQKPVPDRDRRFAIWLLPVEKFQTMRRIARWKVSEMNLHSHFPTILHIYKLKIQIQTAYLGNPS
jgi:hypothetical protein